MLRRLYRDQPESFAFTPANRAWAEGQVKKYPAGRQASAVIPLLWRAQEQEGWLSRAAIEHVADMLGMAHIRALEVATFYFMFQLQPVGSVAHVQVCGTTSCMICGAEDLVAVCKDRIAPKPHQLSADGKFSWEEVECLGACANAPMAQIGKDYYEDLTAKRLGEILDELAAGKVPLPGPQNGRYAAEPLKGLTSLTDHFAGRAPHNASAALAVAWGDTVKRIDGTEKPAAAPKRAKPVTAAKDKPAAAKPAKGKPADATGAVVQAAVAKSTGKPAATSAAKAAAKPAAKPAVKTAAKVPAKAAAKPAAPKKPKALKTARKGGPDDLKRIKGVGPKLEALLHSMGFFHFDQVAAWTEADVAWVDENLEGFKGRVSREDWVAQAKALAGKG